jgi:hypothetical protein
MKQSVIRLGAVCTCLLFFFSTIQVQAQVSRGKNPEYIFHKYYPAFGANNPVTEVGDSLGTIYFRGLTAESPMTTLLGASITTKITGTPSIDSLPVNLTFRTGPIVQRDRLTITSDGLVGIGTTTPSFNLHTIGNTHTTGDFYGRIHFDANPTTNDAPDTYIDEAYFELKQRATIGVPAGPGTYGGLFSLAPGEDALDHQLFFGEDGIFTRRWAGDANSWAGSTWYKMLTGEDINGTPNQVAKFTGPNSLGDSQIFDDGTQVGIGTMTPGAGLFLDVNGNSRINGAGMVTGNFEVNGTSTLSTTTVGGILTVNGATDLNGTANIASNTTIGGLLTVNNDADINGAMDVSLDAHVGGVMTIGTFNTPGLLGTISTADYSLFVEGGILTEEVLVRSGWADYVFEKDYNLPSLEEVESHIDQKGYLPGMPSAEAVETEGLELRKATVDQQVKIEELFLYLIQLNKEVQSLKAENAALKAQIEK